MRLSQIAQEMTQVPIDLVRQRFDDATVLAAMPVRNLEQGAACVLVARQGRLWVIARVDGGGPTMRPSVAIDAVEWHEVGIGPQGLVGRVPGGLLGGPEATFHLATVQAGAWLYEARLPGARGMQVVEDFVGVARHAGARDLEL